MHKYILFVLLFGTLTSCTTFIRPQATRTLVEMPERTPLRPVIPVPNIVFTVHLDNGRIMHVNTTYGLHAQMMSLARTAIEVQKKGRFADTCNPQVEVSDEFSVESPPEAYRIRARLAIFFINEDITKAGSPRSNRDFSYWTDEDVYQAERALVAWIQRRNSCNYYDRAPADLGQRVYSLK